MNSMTAMNTNAALMISLLRELAIPIASSIAFYVIMICQFCGA